MKTVLLALFAGCMIFLTACSSGVKHASWIPVTSGPPRPPVNEQDVLIMNDFPVQEYVMIGRFEPAPGSRGKLEWNDPAYTYLKKEAAAMGGNTIVVRDSPLKFKSGKGNGDRVEVLFVREEVGTHGGEDWGSDTVPLNEELLKIY